MEEKIRRGIWSPPPGYWVCCSCYVDLETDVLTLRVGKIRRSIYHVESFIQDGVLRLSKTFASTIMLFFCFV